MRRASYDASTAAFLATSPQTVVGHLAQNSRFPITTDQRNAWLREVVSLRTTLADLAQDSISGWVYLEWAVPRMGKYIDVVLLLGPVIFVLEYKVGATRFSGRDTDQVWDYALDLKYFHEPSHNRFVAPILVATDAPDQTIELHRAPDLVFEPIPCNDQSVARAIRQVLSSVPPACPINPLIWEQGRYSPTPTIIEAARALYRRHQVTEITRCDAAGQELQRTSDRLASIIDEARSERRKAICFVTGVPGAGKTLIGLNLATQTFGPHPSDRGVFLSGNGPLVQVLQEALARDNYARERLQGRNVTLGEARRNARTFIQNVHLFRDEYVRDKGPPSEHVLIFDEAQRAWNREQTERYMRQRRKVSGFPYSEPEFLLHCADRHSDWAAMICLVGGGQEINTGEAGIGEWIRAVTKRDFRHWLVYISPQLEEEEYDQSSIQEVRKRRNRVIEDDLLHLKVSMRSYRAQYLSDFVKYLLDCRIDEAGRTYEQLRDRYRIVLTRNLDTARQWLRDKARGTERYGIVASSSGYRLKPLGIEVRLKPSVVHWFLADKDDIRSSYCLEDVATEFQIQGLELDWTCVTWDADLRYRERQRSWEHYAFRGKRWVRVNQPQRRVYQKNAYRVLLTRARQGMVLCVPYGSREDRTRNPAFYDSTYAYLRELGLETLE